MPIAVTDGLTGLTAIAVVWSRTPSRHRLRVLAGMAGGSLPDLDKPAQVFFGASPFPRAVDDLHARIQTRESAARLPQEVVVALGAAVPAQGRPAPSPGWVDAPEPPLGGVGAQGGAGGGRGIRTPEGVNPTRFPSERHRPLGDTSAEDSTGRLADR